MTGMARGFAAPMGAVVLAVATAAAQYQGAGFKARVVSGSRCTRGIGAAAAEPVLAV